MRLRRAGARAAPRVAGLTVRGESRAKHTIPCVQGSNVRALQTTATYMPQDDTFDVHTPTIEATKWWIGGLVRSAAWPAHPHGTACPHALPSHPLRPARPLLDGIDLREARVGRESWRRTRSCGLA